MRVHLDAVERQELRLAIRTALSDPLPASTTTVLRGIYAKLARLDGLRFEIRSVTPFETIGNASERVIERLHAAIREERDHTEAAVIGLGDRYAGLVGRR